MRQDQDPTLITDIASSRAEGLRVGHCLSRNMATDARTPADVVGFYSVAPEDEVAQSVAFALLQHAFLNQDRDILKKFLVDAKTLDSFKPLPENKKLAQLDSVKRTFQELWNEGSKSIRLQNLQRLFNPKDSVDFGLTMALIVRQRMSEKAQNEAKKAQLSDLSQDVLVEDLGLAAEAFQVEIHDKSALDGDEYRPQQELPQGQQRSVISLAKIQGHFCPLVMEDFQQQHQAAFQAEATRPLQRNDEFDPSLLQGTVKQFPHLALPPKSKEELASEATKLDATSAGDLMKQATGSADAPSVGALADGTGWKAESADKNTTFIRTQKGDDPCVQCDLREGDKDAIVKALCGWIVAECKKEHGSLEDCEIEIVGINPEDPEISAKLCAELHKHFKKGVTPPNQAAVTGTLVNTGVFAKRPDDEPENALRPRV